MTIKIGKYEKIKREPKKLTNLKKKMLERNFLSQSKYAYEINGDKVGQKIKETTPDFFKTIDKIEMEAKLNKTDFKKSKFSPVKNVFEKKVFIAALKRQEEI